MASDSYVLVTGGAGFIGSHVVDALAGRGERVVVVDDLSTGSMDNLARWKDDPRVEVIEADIADELFAVLSGRELSGIVHLAAQVSVVRSIERPLTDLRVNSRGTVQVLELARRQRSGCKVVFASSAAVYGDVEQVPTPEEAPQRPLSPYGIDKYAAEHWLRYYAEVLDVPTSALRFFNVYGPRQDPSSAYSGVISIFAARAQQGRGITIYGDGEQTRDFVFVGDVVRSIVAALDLRDSTPPCNVGTGRSVTVHELARVICETSKSSSEISLGPARLGEIKHSCAKVTRLEERLGVVAQTSLEDGLRQTLESLQPPVVVSAGSE